MSIFDESQFLDATTTEALEKRSPIPAGSDVVGTLLEPKGRSGEKDGKAWTAIDFPVEVDLAAYPALHAIVGQDKVQLKYGFVLDINENGSIDWSKGKNNRLRRLREAVGMNKPGASFNIRAMQGRMIKLKVKHREFEGELFDEIDAISAA